MTEIRNTTADMHNPDSPDALLLLITAMDGGGPENFIYAQERAGQRQLVNSAKLPAEGRGDIRGQLASMGIALGEPDPDDPLFAPATLPDGWTKQPSDHDMWSYVVDTLGRRRVAVFYKASWYDRKAFLRVVGLSEYVYGHAHGDNELILDAGGETWATPETVAQAALALADEKADEIAEYRRFAADPAREADRDYWIERVAKLRKTRAAYVALAQKYTAGTLS